MQNRTTGATTESIIIEGGFYTVITVEIDIFESRIIDEKHFGTKEEAERYQRKTLLDGGENVYCFVKYVA